MLAGPRRIGVRHQRDLALEEGEPAALLAVVEAVEKAMGMAEPALCDRQVAAEHDRVVRQPRGGASGRRRIAARTVGAERSRTN